MNVTNPSGQCVGCSSYKALHCLKCVYSSGFHWLLLKKVRSEVRFRKSTLPEMSYRLSKPSVKVRETAAGVLKSAGLREESTQREKAVAMFNFVRDEISFGFTGRFDNASPDETLTLRRGHCNPQGALFASLCNAVGLPARQRFVAIGSDVLRGVLDGFTPPRLLHSYVEVDIDRATRRLDAYIIGRKLFDAASERLRDEKEAAGYGLSSSGTIDWDGTSDAFVQMTGTPLQDYGPYDTPLDLLRSPNNFQAIPMVGRIFFPLGTVLFNRRIDNVIRAHVSQSSG